MRLRKLGRTSVVQWAHPLPSLPLPKTKIISEAARGVMQGASQLLQKKLRTIKVTLKGGYRLFLVQSNETIEKDK